MIKKIAAIYAFISILSSVSGIEAPDIEKTENDSPQELLEDVMNAEADEEFSEKVAVDVTGDLP